MASARGRKRRTQCRRCQKGRRQKRRGRRSPCEQRKRRGQAKRRPVKKQRRRALKRSFNYSRTLNRVRRDSQFLSHQAEEFILNFVEHIYEQVLSEAEQLRRQSRHPLISPVHV